MSWNSMTRRLAFAGSPRTEFWPSARRSDRREEPFASCVSFRVAVTASPSRASCLHVLLQVPAGAARRAQAAVGLLLLVLHLDLGEVHADRLDGKRIAAAGTARLVAGDEEVGELDRQVVLLLAPAGLAAGGQNRLDVVALRAPQHQLGARLVHLHGEVEVLHVHLARAAAAAAGVGAGVARAPAPGLQIDV